jgi:hypothetical protein
MCPLAAIFLDELEDAITYWVALLLWRSWVTFSIIRLLLTSYSRALRLELGAEGCSFTVPR